MAVVEKAPLPNLHDDVKLCQDGALGQIHDIGLLDLFPIETGVTLDVRIGRGFSGLLDDVRLYDRALTMEEVKGFARYMPGAGVFSHARLNA